MRIILDIFSEEYKCPGIVLFSKASDMILMSSHVKKQLLLYDDLLSKLFHFFNFIFKAPISFNLGFPISVPVFLIFLSQAFIKYSRKYFVHI